MRIVSPPTYANEAPLVVFVSPEGRPNEYAEHEHDENDPEGWLEVPPRLHTARIRNP